MQDVNNRKYILIASAGFALINIGLARASWFVSRGFYCAYSNIFGDPPCLPQATQFVIDFHWWPWILVAASLVCIPAILLKKDQAKLIAVCLCIVSLLDIVALVFTLLSHALALITPMWGLS